MNLLITLHIPLKAKFSKEDMSCTVYIPLKKWFFAYGGWGKQKWFRILGLTFLVGYHRLWPVTINLEIQ